MTTKNKILVTGGLGFIGHNIVRSLCQLGHEISIIDISTNYGLIPQAELDCIMQQRIDKISPLGPQIHHIDIADQHGVDQVMKNFRPQTIVHLASFPRQKVVNSDPILGSRTMSEGLLNLLEASKKHDVSKFVYVSSSMVYGDFTNDINEDALCRPQGQYGIMKLAGEWLVRDYTRRGNFDHVIIRPSAVYGELDVEDRVVSRYMLTAMRGGILKVNGLSETLDFTHVQDVTNGIVSAAIKTVAHNKTYNMTRGRSRSLLDAANLAVKIAGRGTIEIRDKDVDFPSRGSLNIDRARYDLDFDPQIDIEQGFRYCYEWLCCSKYWTKNINANSIY